MEMIFSNKRGQIRMDGGCGNAPLKIRSAEGLGYMTRNAVTAVYPFSPGQKTLSRSTGARLITVAADAAEGGKSYDAAFAAIAHDSGVLYITHGRKKVYAECYISNMSVTRAKGKDYEKYVFQFTCDYPYFRDAEPTLAPLFCREKLIKDTIAFPKVLSRRITDNFASVSGDKEVYPVITVGEVSSGEEFSLAVENETTGARLSLRLPAGNYERIVFDLWNGGISCGGEDLTMYLESGSYMGDFYLARGENKIKAAAMETSLNTSAAVSFENEYFTAWDSGGEEL